MYNPEAHTRQSGWNFTCIIHVRTAASAVDVMSVVETNMRFVNCVATVNRSSTARYDGNDASTVSIVDRHGLCFPLLCAFCDIIAIA